MAADVDSPPLVDTRRLEGTLVSPRAPRPVPNHLADTSKSMNRLFIMKVCVESVWVNNEVQCWQWRACFGHAGHRLWQGGKLHTLNDLPAAIICHIGMLRELHARWKWLEHSGELVGSSQKSSTTTIKSTHGLGLS